MKHTYRVMAQATVEALASRNATSVRRTLHVAEDKVATFTTFVPWPALAASFQDDVNFLRSINEPQDRQSPAQS